jgi:prolyl-tRNA synthetase
LESKYTDALNLYYNDENGKKQSIIMGCYGIGISRLMGVIAELFADDKGLIWPTNIAPFQAHILSLRKDAEAEKLYAELQEKGIEVMLDDRDTSAGAKFADADLIGIPFQIVVSEKTLADNQVEIKERKTGVSERVACEAEAIAKYLSDKK